MNSDFNLTYTCCAVHSNCNYYVLYLKSFYSSDVSDVFLQSIFKLNDEKKLRYKYHEL